MKDMQTITLEDSTQEDVLLDPDLKINRFSDKKSCFERCFICYMERKFEKYVVALENGETSDGPKTKQFKERIKILSDIPVIGEFLALPIEAVTLVTNQVHQSRQHTRAKQVIDEITAGIEFKEDAYQRTYLRSVFEEVAVELSMIYARQLSEMNARGINVFADLCSVRAFSVLSMSSNFTVSSIINRIVTLGKNKAEHIYDKGVRFKKREIETEGKRGWTKSIFSSVGIETLDNQYYSRTGEKGGGDEKYGYRHPTFNSFEKFDDFGWKQADIDLNARAIGQESPMYIELNTDLLEGYLQSEKTALL